MKKKIAQMRVNKEYMNEVIDALETSYFNVVVDHESLREVDCIISKEVTDDVADTGRSESV